VALTLGSVCLIVAIILFILAAFPLPTRGVSLMAIGLAFFAAAFLVGGVA
jgi:hypothetical protein